MKFFLLLFLFVGQAQAGTQWEVGVVFLGARENAAYQKDIDHNILELSRSYPNDLYRLSVYRELENRSVEYFVDPKSKKFHSWDPLFATKPPTSIQVPGELNAWEKRPGEKSIVQEPVLFARFAEQAFQNPKA